MPSVQVIDLNPSPRTEATPLEQTLSAFSKRQRENQVEAQETDALRQIYGKYKEDGRLLDDAIMDIQTRPGISPTTRVNSINQLLNMQKHNAQLQKDALKQQKAVEQETRKQAEANAKIEEENNAVEALKKGGATDLDVELYKASPVGGKTKVIESVIEKGQRETQPPGFENPDVEDYDKGLTPRERVKRQDDRFKLQTPLVNKNSESLNALENEGMSIDLLDELTDSGKVGEGLHKLNINPKTGDLIIPQVGTPEEQLFVKTVNDFTVKAKDSFGARVTNFELDRFMQRLPTLANSAEGRKLILRQMKIINQINKLEKQAIQEVFDQYGVRNIDYVDAENMARRKISDQKDTLRKQYTDLEQLAKKEDAALLQSIKSKVQPGYVPLRKPDGTIKQFPEKNVPNLLEKGYKNI